MKRAKYKSPGGIQNINMIHKFKLYGVQFCMLNAVELTVSQFVEDASDGSGAPLTRHGHLKLVFLESKVFR